MSKNFDVERIRKKAEDYYRNGDFYCSEAIIKTIKDEFHFPITDEVIKMASGFHIGMGRSDCICGAVIGGVMALGLFFSRIESKDAKVSKAMELAK